MNRFRGRTRRRKHNVPPLLSSGGRMQKGYPAAIRYATHTIILFMLADQFVHIVYLYRQPLMPYIETQTCYLIAGFVLRQSYNCPDVVQLNTMAGTPNNSSIFSSQLYILDPAIAHSHPLLKEDHTMVRPTSVLLPSMTLRDIPSNPSIADPEPSG